MRIRKGERIQCLQRASRFPERARIKCYPPLPQQHTHTVQPFHYSKILPRTARVSHNTGRACACVCLNFNMQWPKDSASQMRRTRPRMEWNRCARLVANSNQVHTAENDCTKSGGWRPLSIDIISPLLDPIYVF